ncbi:hypothetical protein RchiOBHm_Chr3g0497371 [Rosa chinensis]|uniref:Uncharacterized protein n=1 Tax=Rosa chinensis TaxID=74649 RepID=A0A2P6RHQ6_ROSCH|nr:hypothetical protein RchiOBHm_Chr3g0497371 [Rosa chinensis]
MIAQVGPGDSSHSILKVDARRATIVQPSIRTPGFKLKGEAFFLFTH